MSRYAFEFAWDSTYGIAAKMLDDASRPGLVLDLGCGEATFAQPIIELGREYLGVELDQGSVDRCREAGLDVHLVDLAEPGHRRRPRPTGRARRRARTSLRSHCST